MRVVGPLYSGTAMPEMWVEYDPTLVLRDIRSCAGIACVLNIELYVDPSVMSSVSRSWAECPYRWCCKVRTETCAHLRSGALVFSGRVLPLGRRRARWLSTGRCIVICCFATRLTRE